MTMPQIDAPLLESSSGTELTDAQRQAVVDSLSDELQGLGGGDVIDAKAHLAEALVTAGGAIPDATAKAIEYLYWSLGPRRAGPIIRRQMQLRLRQNTGFARQLVDAIKALATIENKEASLFGSMGKGGDK